MTQTPLELSYCRGAGDAALPEQTIGDALDQAAARFPDHPALVVDHQQIFMSYAEYRDAANHLAVGLLEAGIEPGDRVGIWSPNCYQWCLTQFATAKMGAILVCINPAYRVYELEYALNRVACKALITAARFKSSDYCAMLAQLAPELASCPPGALQAEKLPALRQVICLDPAPPPGMSRFTDLCAAGTAAQLQRLAQVQASLQPHEAINIQFTSGTTGAPKGATLSHHNVLNNGLFVGAGMGLTEADRLCIPVPLYHCFGMVMGNLACITHGAAAVFPGEAFDPEDTLRVVSEQRCTALHGVPTMFIAELEHPNFERFDLSSLRTGIMAGAPCPMEIMTRVIEAMHMRDVLIAYGQTESSPVNHMTTIDDPIEKRVGSVGRPAAHAEIKIIDAEGNTLPVGVRGEICCRGYAVMQGYWNDREQTTNAIDADGWLHSGDLGVMDAQGYMEVVGRIKDMIIRGGENIYPREIEEFLHTHPAVQDVQVFGVPDQKYGEQVCAWINKNSDMDAASIQQYCRDHIAHFKVPQYIRFVSEFPMTVTGKVQKFKMRESMLAELAADKDEH